MSSPGPKLLHRFLRQRETTRVLCNSSYQVGNKSSNHNKETSSSSVNSWISAEHAHQVLKCVTLMTREVGADLNKLLMNISSRMWIPGSPCLQTFSSCRDGVEEWVVWCRSTDHSRSLDYKTARSLSHPDTQTFLILALGDPCGMGSTCATGWCCRGGGSTSAQSSLSSSDKTAMYLAK